MSKRLNAEYAREGRDAVECASPREEREWEELEAKLKKCQADKHVKQEKQIGGNHYNLPIQPIDYIVKNNLGYREGNVIKYVSRHKNKNGKEDILKAIHYLEMIIGDYDDK